VTADALKATPYRHRGCGGVIVASLDGDTCSICGREIASDDELCSQAGTWCSRGEYCLKVSDPR